MPELPEVETTRQGLLPYVQGQKIKKLDIREYQLRWPIPGNLSRIVKRLEVVSLDRRGKYLLFNTTKGCLISHLGMSGSFSVVADARPAEKHHHFDLVLESGHIIRYHDPRKFGALLWTAEPASHHKLLSHLGPEPLGDDFDVNYLQSRLKSKKTAIKTAIMDSKVVVGVGNIYANEALYMAGIHPLRASNKIGTARLEALVQSIKDVLATAIKRGGTTLRDFTGTDGTPGYFAQTLAVYGRGGSPCKACDSTLKEVRLSNRSTVYCPKCQR